MTRGSSNSSAVFGAPPLALLLFGYQETLARPLGLQALSGCLSQPVPGNRLAGGEVTHVAHSARLVTKPLSPMGCARLHPSRNWAK